MSIYESDEHPKYHKYKLTYAQGVTENVIALNSDDACDNSSYPNADIKSVEVIDDKL